MTQEEKQKQVAMRLNCMGWIAVSEDTSEQLSAIVIGAPIIMFSS